MLPKSSKVRSYYDSYAQGYDSFYTTLQEHKFREIENLINLDKPLIIDLGGGTGIINKFVNSSIITIDISRLMLQQGIENHRIVSGIAADMCALPFRDSIVNRILSITAIHNVENIQIAISEIERIACSDFEGIITVLKKSKFTKILIKSFQNSQFNVKEVESGTEDRIFIIH